MAHGSSIFISYRRHLDKHTAGWLADHLGRAFGSGRICYDKMSIPPGVDYIDFLQSQVANCVAFVPVIGNGWHAERHRLHDPEDMVHVELLAALNRTDLPIIPVLVDGAGMPKRDDLPKPLRPLRRRSAVELPHSFFSQIIETTLVPRLREIVGSASPALTDGPTRIETTGIVHTAHAKSVYALALSRDETMLASSGLDQKIKIWRIDDLTRERASVDTATHAPILGQVDLSTLFSHLRAMLVHPLHTLDISGETLDEKSRLASSPSFSPDGRLLAFTTGLHYAVWLFDGKGNATLYQPHARPVRNCVFLPGSEDLAIGAKKSVVFEDVTSDLPAHLRYSNRRTIDMPVGGIEKLICSANGLRLAVAIRNDRASPANRVLVFAPRSRERLFALSSGSDPVHDLDFSADGSSLVTVHPSGQLRVIDTATGKETARGECANDGLHAVKVGADGARAVTGNDNGRLQLWETVSGREIAAVDSGTSSAYAIALTANGALAVGGADGKIRLFRLA